MFMFIGEIKIHSFIRKESITDDARYRKEQRERGLFSPERGSEGQQLCDESNDHKEEKEDDADNESPGIT